MEENFSMKWNMEWKIFRMEWKKIARMEYGKIIFHSIPYHALPRLLLPARAGTDQKLAFCLLQTQLFNF